MTARLSLWLAGLIALIVGCQPSSPVPSRSESGISMPPQAPTNFDLSKAVSIDGIVIWVGPKPTIHSIRGHLSNDNVLEEREFENPNRLQFAGDSDRVVGAVVYLENVDLQEACPWYHPPVRVHVDDLQIRTIQGGYRDTSRVGIVRDWSEVEFVATDHASHVLNLRGAEFFGMSLPEVGIPRRHRLEKCGVVEISSAAYRPWHRAYLWVAANPYFTMTNDRGEFQLRMVPPGEYEIHVWHPNPEILTSERDPNTGLVTRLRFGPPFTSRRKLVVGQDHGTVTLTLSK